jgi:hypothetical protein
MMNKKYKVGVMIESSPVLNQHGGRFFRPNKHKPQCDHGIMAGVLCELGHGGERFKWDIFHLLVVAREEDRLRKNLCQQSSAEIFAK